MGRPGSAISLIAPQDIGNLYYLRLTYNIHPVEKTITDDAQSAKAMEIVRIKELRRAFGVKMNGGFLGLARRLLQDVYTERIIAGLLANHFDSQPKVDGTSDTASTTDPIQATLENGRKIRTDEAPERPGEKKEKPEDRMQKKQAKKRDEKAVDKPDKTLDEPKKTEAKSKSPKKEKEQIAEIFIDAGRKDGLRIAHLMQEIVNITGLPRSALGKVRMLTRSTFVAVPKEHLDAVMKSIGEIEIQNRKLKAEPAEQS
jgi:ATP-dependent RNA helicase DeaD